MNRLDKKQKETNYVDVSLSINPMEHTTSTLLTSDLWDPKRNCQSIVLKQIKIIFCCKKIIINTKLRNTTSSQKYKSF